jgi:hypothetical protein
MMSVCMSAWNNSDPTGRIFVKFNASWVFFEGLLRKFKFHSNWPRITRHMKTNTHLWSHLTQLFFKQEMLQTKAVDTFHVQYTFFLNLAIYDTMQKNIVQPGRWQMIKWGMCIVCWIPRATNTHTLRICNTYWFFFFFNGCKNVPQSYIYKHTACLV